MNPSELREMDVPQLNAEVLRLRKEQFHLRMHRASGQLGQTHLITEARRDLARVKTVLQEKQDG